MHVEPSNLAQRLTSWRKNININQLERATELATKKLLRKCNNFGSNVLVYALLIIISVNWKHNTKTVFNTIYLYSYSYYLTTGPNMFAGPFIIVFRKFGERGETSTLTDLKYSKRWSMNLFCTHEAQMETQSMRVCRCQERSFDFTGLFYRARFFASSQIRLYHSLFYVSLTVHLSITLANDQLDAQIFNTFITILYMYMFRTIFCSSSGGQVVLIQHLISSLSVSDRPVHTCAQRRRINKASDTVTLSKGPSGAHLCAKKSY
jgi:hypothetical protein